MVKELSVGVLVRASAKIVKLRKTWSTRTRVRGAPDVKPSGPRSLNSEVPADIKETIASANPVRCRVLRIWEFKLGRSSWVDRPGIESGLDSPCGWSARIAKGMA